MKMNTDPKWLETMATKEDGQFVSTGLGNEPTDRVQQVSDVIYDKWLNGDGSQVGDAEDYGLSDVEMDSAVSIACRQWDAIKRREVTRV